MTPPEPVRNAPGDAAADAAASAAVASEAAWAQTRTLLRSILVVLLVAAALWLFYTLEGVLLLLIFAVFFAYLLAPLVDLVRRPLRLGTRECTVSRGPAIALVYAAVIGLLVFGGWMLLPRLTHQLAEFARQAPSYATGLRDRLQPWLSAIHPERMPDGAQAALHQASTTLAGRLEATLSAVALGLLSIAGYLPWLVLVPVLSFFLLKDADLIRRGALLSLPAGQLRGRGAQFFHDVNLALAAYVRAQLTACLIIGMVCTLAFVLMDVPYALVLGVVAGLLEFVPLVGPFVVAVLAVGAASLASAGHAVSVLVFLALLRVAEDYVVYPRLIGHGVHLHPLAVILAVLCGAELGGVTGIFLSIPVVAVLSVGHRHWLEHRGSEGIVADLLTPPEPDGATIGNAERLRISEVGPRRQSGTAYDRDW